MAAVAAQKKQGFLLKKTKMCRFFENGHCRWGGKCRFAHSTTELRAVPNLRFTEVRPQLHIGHDLRTVNAIENNEVAGSEGSSNCGEDDTCSTTTPRSNDDLDSLTSTGPSVTTPVAKDSQSRLKHGFPYSVKNTFINIDLNEGNRNFDSGPRVRSRSAPPVCNPTTTMKTTVMLKNVPFEYNISMLLSLLDTGFEQRFRHRYDCAYLPEKFEDKCIFGYAFVNFVNHEDAAEFQTALDGFTGWEMDEHVPGAEVAAAKTLWGYFHGQEEWILKYRNNNIMHHEVPKEFQPMLFRDGVPVAFPPPTKTLQKPRALKVTQL